MTTKLISKQARLNATKSVLVSFRVTSRSDGNYKILFLSYLSFISCLVVVIISTEKQIAAGFMRFFYSYLINVYLILASAASTLASGTPGVGELSVGSQASSDLLLGSLQSTLPSKSSWEPGSFGIAEERRTSSKKILRLG